MCFAVVNVHDVARNSWGTHQGSMPAQTRVCPTAICELPLGGGMSGVIVQFHLHFDEKRSGSYQRR